MTSAASSEDSRSTSTRWPPPAAVAMAERGEDADRREEAGEDVDERDADLLRLAVGLAGDAHQPAEGLDEQVVAGQRRAGAARRSR